MDINNYFDDICFSSLRNDLSSTTWQTLRTDAVAGVTVALLAIPQTMAYALLAGLPMSCGIFAAIFSAVIATICGSSRHLVVGPSSAIAIMIQVGTAQILYTHFRDFDGPEREFMAINILMQLTLMVGFFQLAAAGLKLGRLIQFVSHPVIIGYLIGVACAMGVTQLYTFLGLPKYDGVYSTYDRLVNLVMSIDLIHLPTTLFGLLSLILFVALRKIDPRIPAGVIGLFLVSCIVSVEAEMTENGFFGSAFEAERVYHVALVGDTGLLNGLIPSVAFPYFSWELINGMIPFAFAVSLLSVLESTSIAKSISAATGQRLSVNQEILGLGLGNLVSSFVGAMPVSGSPSRSALNFYMGAQTRFSSFFSAAFVALFLFIFEPLISQIPLTALAALLILTAPKMINRKQLTLCLNATSSDAFVLWATVFSCLFFSLEVAFYIGVGLSITLYLKKAAKPLLSECIVDDFGAVHPLGVGQKVKNRRVRLIKVEGELFFGAAEIFNSTLRTLSLADSMSKVIILEMKNARDMDATACLALQQLHNYLSRSGRHLVICGITPPVWKVLNNADLVMEIGKENLFSCCELETSDVVGKALDRSVLLLEQSDDIVKILRPNDSPSESVSFEHAH